MDTGTTIYNTKAVSDDEKALATTYTCPDCSNEVMPDRKDLVGCICELMFAKDPCIVNDKVMGSVKK